MRFLVDLAVKATGDVAEHAAHLPPAERQLSGTGIAAPLCQALLVK
jgi:hypothetical protein